MKVIIKASSKSHDATLDEIEVVCKFVQLCLNFLLLTITLT